MSYDVRRPPALLAAGVGVSRVVVGPLAGSPAFPGLLPELVVVEAVGPILGVVGDRARRTCGPAARCVHCGHSGSIRGLEKGEILDDPVGSGGEV